MFYKPVIDKEFDFVTNPNILQPVIQVMYEVKLKITLREKPEVKTKEYLIVSEGGKITKLENGNFQVIR